MHLAGKPAFRSTILHLSPDLEPGAPAREAVDLAVLTQRAGWRALIASAGGALVTEAERAAVRHIRLPLNGRGLFANWRSARGVAHLVQSERPLLIHAHDIEAVAAALHSAQTQNVPLVADLSSPLEDKPRNRRILKKLEKVTAAVRVPTEFMAQNLQDQFKWPSSRLQVIPPGVDLQWSNPGAIGPDRLQNLTRLWRLPEQAAVILMPMPFTPGGGHERLLEALAQLKRNDVYAVLVGDNRPVRGVRDEIEQLIDELKLGGKVVLPDCCMDWPAACWLATAVVAPNIAPRGFAHELLVAQSLGRPVIISDCGANREMAESGVTAWVVPPDDSAALANALNEIIRLPTSRRIELSQRAIDFIAEVFPQAAWFNGMMDLYDSITLPVAARKQAAAA